MAQHGIRNCQICQDYSTGDLDAFTTLLADESYSCGPCRRGNLMIEACGRQTPDVVEELERAGGRYNPHRGRMKSISVAAAKGNVAMAKYFLKNGADPNATYSPRCAFYEGPPLLAAVKQRRSKVIEMLLEAGANQNVTNSEGESAIQAAQLRGYDDILDLLNGVVSSTTPDLE